MEKVNGTPDLRFPEFDGSQPNLKFDEVVKSNIYGPRFNANDYDEIGNVKTIRGTDVDNNGEFKYAQVPTANLDKKTVEHHMLEDGDLVMITTAECGLTGVFREQSMPFISSAYGVRIRLNEKGIPDYFKYFFQTKHARKEVSSFIRKATVANLPGSDILRIRLNLPQPEEQIKIANYLTAVDKRIQLLQKKKAKLEEYKKGVMQQLFSQEIRFKIEGPDGELVEPPDWEEKKLGEVLFEHKEKNIGTKYEEVFSVAKNKGVINQIDHLGRSYSADSIAHYKLINPNDIVYTKSPTSDFPFGIVKQNQTGRTGVLSPLYAVFKPENQWIGNILHSYFLSGINTYNYLVPLVQKGAKNTMNINNNDFLNGAKISLPVNQEEQQKIASFLTSMDKSIKKVELQIENLKTFKKGLLQKMFI